MLTALIVVPLVILGLLAIAAGLQGSRCDRLRCEPYEAQYHRPRQRVETLPAAPAPTQPLYLKAE
jgi:hypothetical protein